MLCAASHHISGSEAHPCTMGNRLSDAPRKPAILRSTRPLVIRRKPSSNLAMVIVSVKLTFSSCSVLNSARTHVWQRLNRNELMSSMTFVRYEIFVHIPNKGMQMKSVSAHIWSLRCARRGEKTLLPRPNGDGQIAWQRLLRVGILHLPVSSSRQEKSSPGLHGAPSEKHAFSARGTMNPWAIRSAHAAFRGKEQNFGE